MAAVVTITYDGDPDVLGGPQRVRRIIMDWTSHTDGAATGTTKKISGHIIKIITNPGSTAPTDNYDIAITGDESDDILANSIATLANRDTSTTEIIYPFVKDAAATPLEQSVFPVVCDVLSIAVTNAGSTKDGKIVIYWTPD